MKKTLITLIALAGVTLVFTGCETAVVDHGAYLPINTTVNDVENRAGIVLLDSRVQQSVTSPGIQETRLPDGRLQVAVQLRNRESRRIQVQANCEFKDAQGFTLDATPFENVILNENGQETVKFISMNERPVRYTIRVREAH
jgi:hypothetical protein